MGSRFVAHCSPTSMPVNCAPREGCALRHRGVAQSGSAPALGAGCRGFESLHPDHFNFPSGMPQRREVPQAGVRQARVSHPIASSWLKCSHFLMVAVAHQVEHRIVAPEVAGSRPVSHPTSHSFFARVALEVCRVELSEQHRGLEDRSGSSNSWSRRIGPIKS